jgi:hypothetical protein
MSLESTNAQITAVYVFLCRFFRLVKLFVNSFEQFEILTHFFFSLFFFFAVQTKQTLLALSLLTLMDFVLLPEDVDKRLRLATAMHWLSMPKRWARMPVSLLKPKQQRSL